MRTGKELIQASKTFAIENVTRSWVEVVSTILLLAALLTVTALTAIPIWARFLVSIIAGLTHVRLFVIYHDYQHRAILSRSKVAEVLMKGIGLYLIAPDTIWRRTHDHHHNNNSKLSTSGIGSYPTVSKSRYQRLSKKEKTLYLINRNPAVILLGYFTLFIYWLNLKSFFESPSKHADSLVSVAMHFVLGGLAYYFIGMEAVILTWWLPFFLAYSIGAYLFYAQHNFPGAKFRENQDWAYDFAAIASTSYMHMNPVMHWFTANIGYHHVHHLNSRIPFYRLPEAMSSMPELDTVPTTRWTIPNMIQCFRLKLWDPERDTMITLREFKKQLTQQKQKPVLEHA